MATIISTKTSGVGGLSVTGDASGILQLASADGTTALTINASQNVGIGNSAANVNDQIGAIRPLLVSKSDTATTIAGSQAAIVIGNGDTTTNNTSQLSFAALTGANSTYFTAATINCVFGARTNGQYPTGQLVFSTSTSLNSAPTEKMRIDSSGNVGIGTSSPAQKLHVSSGDNNNGIIQLGATATTGYYSQLNQNSNYLDLISNGDQAFRVSLGTNNGSGQIRFFTATGTTGNTERMRIDASGNVGIGTSSPAQKLTVSATTATQSIVSTTTGNAAFLVLQNSADSSNAYVYATGKELRLSQADTSASSIVTISTQNTERMRIDASGNVGIGTSSPAQKLHIASDGYNFRISNTGNSFGYNLGRNVGDGLLYFYGDQSGNNGYVFSGINGERMRIDASGNLLVGVTAPSTAPSSGFTFNPQAIGAYASVGHSTSAGSGSYFISFGYNGGVIGTITQNGTTGVLYNTGSDQRLKTNIINAPSALASVNAIKVRSFDWKSDGKHQEYGYIAQELLEVAPEAVHVPEDEDQMMGVDFGKLTPRLVKAIQELKAIIDTQNDTINNLTTRLEILEGVK